MNRRQRRRTEAVDYLLSVRGQFFGAACFDCIATAAVGMDDHGELRLCISHAPTCPAAAGIVPWRYVRSGR